MIYSKSLQHNAFSLAGFFGIFHRCLSCIEGGFCFVSHRNLRLELTRKGGSKTGNRTIITMLNFLLARTGIIVDPFRNLKKDFV